MACIVKAHAVVRIISVSGIRVAFPISLKVVDQDLVTLGALLDRSYEIQRIVVGVKRGAEVCNLTRGVDPVGVDH